jgi:hypothetical protein
MGQLWAQQQRDPQQLAEPPVKIGRKPPPLRKLNERSTAHAWIRRSMISGVPEAQALSYKE